MAVIRRARQRWLALLHFGARLLGLTALLATVFAWVWYVLDQREIAGRDVPVPGTVEQLRDLLTDSHLAARVALAGMGVVVFVLLVEMAVLACKVALRRSILGLNALLQCGIALGLLVAVNVYSFQHHARIDLTRNARFTLPDSLAEQLRQLQGNTTIVVYKQHKKFGRLSDKPDAHDYAAERQIIAKVADLIEQFRALGPQFRVEILDVEADDHDRTLDELTADAPPLAAALRAATDNGIFFYTGGRVQSLSFSELAHLDKRAGEQADHGRGNLVLLDQGVAPFARRVLNVDEKPPRIAVATIDEWLTTEGQENYGLIGLKKTLHARGFEVRDLVLKRWPRFGPPEPAVFTHEESRVDQLEDRLANLDSALERLAAAAQELDSATTYWKSASLDDLTARLDEEPRLGKMTEARRQAQIELMIEEARSLRDSISALRVRRAALAEERARLSVESLEEQKRISDLRTKMNRALADCDLLILPRMTLRNLGVGDVIAPTAHRLDDAQVEAIRDFLKSGRPVLACFGPTNESPEYTLGRDSDPDNLEALLSELGIHFGRQTILFDEEHEALADRGEAGLLRSGGHAAIPPIDFDWKPGAGRPVGRMDLGDRPPHPIRQSMHLAARSLPREDRLDLRFRHPRPIYAKPDEDARQKYDPILMMTGTAAWNEDQPYPTARGAPRFERPKTDDPTRGTLDEKRRGPFPIAAALETTLPPHWYLADEGEPRSVRLVVIGHGGWFVGSELNPAREKLLLDTCNWLLGRDDLLSTPGTPWQFPRVLWSERRAALWQWGARLGLPLIFVYLGSVVFLVRRLR